MSRSSYPERTPRARRRTALASVLRSTVSMVVLVSVYYVAPLDRPLNLVTWLGFAGGLLAFGGLIAWEVVAIRRSATPRLRAFEAIAVSLPMLLLLFASTYVLIAHSDAGSFNQRLTRTDALYFTLTVFTTVGFGDIVPVTELARIITMLQMVMGLVAVGVVAKVLVGAVQDAVRRRDTAEPPDMTAPSGDSQRHVSDAAGRGGRRPSP